VLTLKLPPLRERADDVLLLADAFLARVCAEHGLEPKALSADARRRLAAHPWPGNVRELANVMERAALLVDGPTVGAGALVLEGTSASPAAPVAAPPAPARAASLDEAMAEHLRATLEQTGWNISRSAALLGISRNTLRARIERLGLQPPGVTPRKPARAPAPTRPGSAPTALRDVAPVAYTPRHLAERILTSRGALEGERKRVTVLFGDLADSSSLARRLGPEVMHELLDRLFRLALEEVHRYEGTINQFLGDGFMALFGAPLAIEHHERQALLAAAAIQRRLTDEVGELAPADTPPRLRMGLNTGTVVVGRIGDNLRMDYTAVGETTNVAARLQAQAEPGAIVLSQGTYERVRGFADVDSLGPVAVKGADDVVAYRLNGLRPSRSTLDAVPERALSRFVGRDHDLAGLHNALAHAEAGRGQAVGIVSEPGMGKSRLLLEFRQSLTGRRLTYLEGRCVSYGATIPYHPLLETLRTNCRIADTDLPEVAAGKVAAAVAEVGLEAGDTLPYLLHVLGLKEGTSRLGALGPETVKARTFEALRQLTLRGSRLRPVVLVVEDLHWIDRTSEEFLATLADSLPGARVLLVTTYRHGYTPGWMGRSYATQLALRALGESESLEILRSVVLEETLPPTVIGAILTRGEGNPLFVEELARTVRDREYISADLAIPNTLQGVLSARIDRLSEQSKELLQLASVLGREFPSRLLAALWGDPSTLTDRLQELVRLEFLYERTWGADPVYAFTHVLTRDAAYGSLLESHRRRYHGAAGHALEDLFADRLHEAVDLLAHHFGLSAEGEKAVDYALRAADKARRRWANAEALAYFEAALRRLDALPDTDVNRLRRIDGVLEQSEVRFALGEHAEHLQALESITALVGTSGDPRRRAAWHYWVGFLHGMTGSHPSLAIGHCQQAVHTARTGGITDIEAYAQSCLTQVLAFTGDLRQGIEVGEAAVAAFEARGESWWAGRTLGHLVPIANGLGEWERARAYGDKALAHACALDDRRLKIMALLRLASTLIQRGEAQEGLRLCDEATALGPGPFDAVGVQAVRGHALVKAGDFEVGTVLLEKALEWLDRSRLRYTRCQIGLWLAEGYIRGGARPKAELVLRSILDEAALLGYRHLEGVTHRLLAESLDGEDVSEHIEAAIALLRETGAQHELAKVRSRASRAKGAHGRSDEASSRGGPDPGTTQKA
jgi:class 3 adenylate cyclase/tetratricopeptide (TPR) repeat protein